jgi:hypothetical protein
MLCCGQHTSEKAVIYFDYLRLFLTAEQLGSTVPLGEQVRKQEASSRK